MKILNLLKIVFSFRLLISALLILFVSICFSQVGETQQPIVKVLIIQSAKNVSLCFNSEFETDLSRTKYLFNQSDTITISVVGNLFQIRSSSESILSKINKINLRAKQENSWLKIKVLPYGIG